MMQVLEARSFLGKNCTVTYRDRQGNTRMQTICVQKVTYVPMYGACLLGDKDAVWLESVSRISRTD